MMQMILAVSTGLFLFIFSVTIMTMVTHDRKLVERRLKDMFREESEVGRTIKLKKVQHQRTPTSQALANELASADIRMRTEEYITIWILIVLLPAGILLLLGMHIVTVIAVALICAVLPLYFIKQRKAKRLLRFESQLSDALVMAGNALRSGLTFQQAMSNIANEMPDPVGREFGRAVREINLGSNVDLALGNLAERVKSTDLSLAVSAIQIQRQVGGNLLDLLENISNTISDRIKVKNEIRVLTATGRTSGFIIGLLPIGLAVVLMMINPDFIESFFHTKMGIGMLITGVVMELIGFLLIKKVVTIKY